MKNIIPMNEETTSDSINHANELTAANSKRTHVMCFNCGSDIPADPEKSLYENCKEFVLCNGPFILYMIMYIDETVDFHKSRFYADALLDELNKRLFGKMREEIRDHLEGFAFFDFNRQTPGSKDSRIKILLKDGGWYDNYSLNEISDILDEIVSNLYDGTERAFKDESVFIYRVTDSDIESCFDNCGRNNILRIISFGDERLCFGLSLAERQLG